MHRNYLDFYVAFSDRQGFLIISLWQITACSLHGPPCCYLRSTTLICTSFMASSSKPLTMPICNHPHQLSLAWSSGLRDDAVHFDRLCASFILPQRPITRLLFCNSQRTQHKVFSKGVQKKINKQKLYKLLPPCKLAHLCETTYKNCKIVYNRLRLFSVKCSRYKTFLRCRQLYNNTFITVSFVVIVVAVLCVECWQNTWIVPSTSHHTLFCVSKHKYCQLREYCPRAFGTWAIFPQLRGISIKWQFKSSDGAAQLTQETQAPANRSRAVLFPDELKFLRFKNFSKK